MSAPPDDDSEKSHEPTPQKLQKAREKGEIARSTDLSVAAAYAGFLLGALVSGAAAIESLGSFLMAMLDRPEELSELLTAGPALQPVGGMILASLPGLAPWFTFPTVAVILVILAQRGFVFAATKLEPKKSRISIISNAKNKFGRNGLFEFAKSFAKLLLYSICLALFLRSRLPDMIAAAQTGPAVTVAVMGRMCIEFLTIVLVIALCLGGIDALWQHAEHRRKNRMSRKEMMDETKEAEGDPHMKQQRRQRGYDIAMTQMMADVPKADVIIVNPTHFAVALQWSRAAGAAPVCVAKGVDEVAATIRRIATEADVPIHPDPPTARAIHASVDIGQEIAEEHYRAVAAAIRFAEAMRQKTKGRVT